MKLSKLTVATGFALAALSGQAFAVPPAFSTPNIDTYLSGASAPQNVLGALAATLFGANTAGTFDHYHVYYDNGSSPGVNYRAYYGSLLTAQTINGRTIPAGTNVLLEHRAKGGSVHGVNPVAKSFAIAYMPITSGNCTAAAPGLAYEYTCAESGVDGTSGRLPDFGVSDVAPTMFKAPYNKEPGSAAIFNALTAAEAARLKFSTLYELQFGVPATTAVPTTLNTVNGGTVTGLTKAMVSGMLSAGIIDWSQIDSSITTGNTGVVICRRSQGSGTQATFNAMFNNFPCASGSQVSGDTTIARMTDSSSISAFVPGSTTPITIDPTAGYTVVEGPSTGNVRDCLANAQNHTNFTYNWTDDAGGVHPVTVQFGNSTNPFRAIGILSLDSPEGVNGSGTATGTWTYRDLNGVAPLSAGLPNKADVRTGKYDFFAEASMQYRNDGYVGVDGLFHSGTPANGSADQQRRDFIDLFIARAGDPTILNQIASTFTRAAVLAQPNANNIPSTNANVSFVSRGGNQCSSLQWIGF